MICDNCGTPMNLVAKFCSNCGAAVRGEGGDRELSAGFRPPDQSAYTGQASALFSASAAPRPTPSCSVHPRSLAAGSCVQCHNTYCGDCLVIYNGLHHCRSCVARFGTPPPQNRPAYLYQSNESIARPANPSYQYSPPGQPYPYQPPAYPYVPPIRRKEPAVAFLLSFFLPGLGQIYNGEVGKGIMMMILFWLLIWIGVGIVIWLWSIIDAYQAAKTINLGRRA